LGKVGYLKPFKELISIDCQFGKSTMNAILVTGGARYIGSHMVLELLRRDEKVIVIDDLSSGFQSIIPDGVRFIRGDVGDNLLIRGVVEAEQI
jgi:UDP-glucose 4-epimerase